MLVEVVVSEEGPQERYGYPDIDIFGCNSLRSNWGQVDDVLDELPPGDCLRG